MEKGIDLEHNRFLILQGEVEQISMMKPKAISPQTGETGLLEYLEEIIGSSHHVEEIENLQKSLELANEKKIEQSNRVKASLVDLQSHEAAFDSAIGFIKKERQLLKFV